MYMFMSHNIHLNIHMYKDIDEIATSHVYIIMCAFYHASLYGHALLTRKTVHVYVLCMQSEQSQDCIVHSQNPEIAFQSRDCANYACTLQLI